MLAARGGHTEAAAQLLEAGTPWNALDREGHCAGDLAMQGGHQATVDLLLDAGALCSSLHADACNTPQPLMNMHGPLAHHHAAISC